MTYDLWFGSTHHSVGQGLMHSAVLCDEGTVPGKGGAILSVVYDCGSSTSNWKDRLSGELEALEESIRGKGFKSTTHSSSSRIPLDALYLSHFDADHVNGVPHLLKRFNPASIVIPATTAAERVLRVIHTTGNGKLPNLSDTLIDMLVDPIATLKGLSGNETDITVINDPPTAPEERIAPPEEGPKTKGTDGNYAVIRPNQANSGTCTVLSLQTEIIWVVIPWVQPAISSIKDKFREKMGYISDSAFDADLRTLLENLDSNRDRFNAAYKAALKTKRKSDVINFTSLCLYSGPPASVEYRAYRTRKLPTYSAKERWVSRSPIEAWGFGPGWIGTGDANFSTTKAVNAFKQAFQRHLKNVGQVTLPHHGSEHNISTKFAQLFETNVTWIANAGSGNSFNHPANATINLVSSLGQNFVLVNENDKSRFQQCHRIKVDTYPRRRASI